MSLGQSLRDNEQPWLLIAALGVFGGLLLRLINSARPIAAIPIIAMLLWVLLLRGQALTAQRTWCVWLLFLASALAVYAVTGPLWNAYAAYRIGEEPASVPGYNIYVGFNQDSSGSWNMEDSAKLFEYSDMPGSTAQWAQEQMLKEARSRIASGKINFLRLMDNKLRVFLALDSPCVNYTASVLPDTAFFTSACNGFYDVLLCFTLLGGCALWKRREQSPALLLPLFALGLTLAQMLVEVAPRYHYALIPVFLLIGQFAVFGGAFPPFPLPRHHK